MASVNPDWRDGFLFVGNHLSLDFVNTRPVMNGQPVELLSDWNALLRWFRAADLVSEKEMETFVRQWEKRAEAGACLDRLRTFRESLRATALRLKSGEGPASGTVAEINRLLRAYPMFLELRRTPARVEGQKRFELRRPDDLIGPIADAAAEMLVALTPARVRKCETCILHFYDTSKNGTRRWCSMQICGNRSKVAAYAERRRRTNRR
ncbi:MAG TPA: ABATE domain-containing protein [Candidatus Methylomirabilis sp.]|nr:ABATE domain-containing protein [Candidatus Methylomirabilis sp.]